MLPRVGLEPFTAREKALRPGLRLGLQPPATRRGVTQTPVTCVNSQPLPRPGPKGEAVPEQTPLVILLKA